MPSFDIRTPSDFLQKLRDEQADFLKSRCLDARHALNAVMTAYHLHEWVWAGFAKRNYTLHRSWGLRRVHVDEFRRYLFGKCPALEEAEALTNSTKHFGTDRKVAPLPTRKHGGRFSAPYFRMTPSMYPTYGSNEGESANEPKTSSRSWSSSMKTSSGSMRLPNPRSLLVWVVETAIDV